MGKSVHTPKDIVRDRSGDRCEKCMVELTRNIHGVPDGPTARSIHHRQCKRWGGKDSAINLVNICRGCHDEIHADEEKAAENGWIVRFGQFPGHIPYLSWRGWMLPALDGSYALLDFEAGHSTDIAPTREYTRRKRVATRSRRGCRKSRKSPRAA
jgi:hypothetical protein